LHIRDTSRHSLKGVVRPAGIMIKTC
jgi:hypothetical protein